MRYLTGGTTLDYDTTSSYVLSVECSDNRRSDTETFTVNLIRNTVSESSVFFGFIHAKMNLLDEF
jgi:hypothetical protein